MLCRALHPLLSNFFLSLPPSIFLRICLTLVSQECCSKSIVWLFKWMGEIRLPDHFPFNGQERNVFWWYLYWDRTGRQSLAFKYLRGKQKNGVKGANIEYGGNLQMAKYLMPNQHLTVEDQCEIFAIRCEINHLPGNKGEKQLCETKCGSIMSNSHILQCQILNDGEMKTSINDILNGTIPDMKKALEQWRKNLTRRIQYTSIVNPIM